jgi:hypothetical protein
MHFEVDAIAQVTSVPVARGEQLACLFRRSATVRTGPAASLTKPGWISTSIKILLFLRRKPNRRPAFSGQDTPPTSLQGAQILVGGASRNPAAGGPAGGVLFIGEVDSDHRERFPDAHLTRFGRASAIGTNRNGFPLGRSARPGDRGNAAGWSQPGAKDVTRLETSERGFDQGKRSRPSAGSRTCGGPHGTQ